MHTKILIVTNDNVLYLLLKTFIESSGNLVVCEKISDHQQLGKEDTDTSLKLIIVDGKMVDISSIELIYRMRYEYMILCNIWFLTEIQSEVYLNTALEVGANRIINKPIDPQEFSKEVINYIQ